MVMRDGLVVMTNSKGEVSGHSPGAVACQSPGAKGLKRNDEITAEFMNEYKFRGADSQHILQDVYEQKRIEEK